MILSCCSYVAKLSTREERSSDTDPCNCLESNWLQALIRFSRVVNVGVAFRLHTFSTSTQTLQSCEPESESVWAAPISHFADLRIDSNVAIQQTRVGKWVQKCLSRSSFSLCTRTAHWLGRCHPANQSRKVFELLLFLTLQTYASTRTLPSSNP